MMVSLPVEKGYSGAERTSRLEGADGHEEGCAVPANLIETLELIGDLGDSSGNDGLLGQELANNVAG